MPNCSSGILTIAVLAILNKKKEREGNKIDLSDG